MISSINVTMTGSNIWDQVLSRIETKVNRHSFYTWFKPTPSSPTMEPSCGFGFQTASSVTG